MAEFTTASMDRNRTLYRKLAQSPALTFSFELHNVILAFFDVFKKTDFISFTFLVDKFTFQTFGSF